MSEEVIINLCKELSSNKSSFGAVYKCFDNNKDNEDLLTKAANYQDCQIDRTCSVTSITIRELSQRYHK
jgi:hypothetical protein